MRKVLYILGQLSDQDVEWMGRTGQVRRHLAKTTLIHEGKPIHHLYILLAGEMRVEIGTGETIARLQAGEVIGELSLIDSRPPLATVQVELESRVLEIAHQDMIQKLESDTGFASRFYRALASFVTYRMRNTVQQLGYRDAPVTQIRDDEILDEHAMDNVHLAGARFDRLLKKLAGGAQ